MPSSVRLLILATILERRSLPKRLTMKVDEFVRSFRTFEMNLSPPKKDKNLAFKIISEELQNTNLDDELEVIENEKK